MTITEKQILDCAIRDLESKHQELMGLYKIEGEEVLQDDALDYKHLAWLLKGGHIENAGKFARSMDTYPRENIPYIAWGILGLHSSPNYQTDYDRAVAYRIEQFKKTGV